MAVVTNYFTRPSVEDATLTPIVTRGSGVTLTRSNEQAYVGTYGLKAVCSGAFAGQGWQAVFAASVNDYVRFSAYVYGAGTLQMGVVGMQADGITGTGQQTLSSNITASTNWTRYSVVVQLTNGATANVNVRLYTTSAQAITFYTDAMMVQRGAAAADVDLIDYFDGDTTDTGLYLYDWTGTPHASTSTRTDVTATGNPYARIRSQFELRPY